MSERLQNSEQGIFFFLGSLRLRVSQNPQEVMRETLVPFHRANKKRGHSMLPKVCSTATAMDKEKAAASLLKHDEHLRDWEGRRFSS